MRKGDTDTGSDPKRPCATHGHPEHGCQTAMASDQEEQGGGQEDVQQIAEAVKNEAAHEAEDNRPDALAYHVNAFELEVEKFLEVDSWNDINGIDATQDSVEEKLVEEMKTVQEEGDQRRAVIKGGFDKGEVKLGGLDEELKELGKRIEKTAVEAEKAAKEEMDESALQDKAGGDASAPGKENPFASYKDQLKALQGKGGAGGEAVGLAVDDSSTRSRMEKLRAESELLRKCLKEGNKGSFSSYSTTVAGK